MGEGQALFTNAAAAEQQQHPAKHSEGDNEGPGKNQSILSAGDVGGARGLSVGDVGGARAFPRPGRPDASSGFGRNEVLIVRRPRKPASGS